jgi:hypothetical protein
LRGYLRAIDKLRGFMFSGLVERVRCRVLLVFLPEFSRLHRTPHSKTKNGHQYATQKPISRTSSINALFKASKALDIVESINKSCHNFFSLAFRGDSSLRNASGFQKILSSVRIAEKELYLSPLPYITSLSLGASTARLGTL